MLLQSFNGRGDVLTNNLYPCIFKQFCQHRHNDLLCFKMSQIYKIEFHFGGVHKGRIFAVTGNQGVRAGGFCIFIQELPLPLTQAICSKFSLTKR